MENPMQRLACLFLLLLATVTPAEAQRKRS